MLAGRCKRTGNNWSRKNTGFGARHTWVQIQVLLLMSSRSWESHFLCLGSLMFKMGGVGLLSLQGLFQPQMRTEMLQMHSGRLLTPWFYPPGWGRTSNYTLHPGNPVVWGNLSISLFSQGQHGLSNRSSYSHSPGSRKSIIKVLARLVPAQDWEKLPHVSLPFLKDAGNPGGSLLCTCITPGPAFVSLWPSPMCLCVFFFSVSCKDTHYWI